MFASLLPGFREVRAPIAAGYLWLVSAWLLVHDHVHGCSTRTPCSGTIGALDQLQGRFGPAALAASASFVAYFAGALWEPVADWFQETAWRYGVRGRALFRHLALHEGNWFEPPWSAHVSRDGWSQLQGTSLNLFRDVDSVVRARLGVGDAEITAELTQIIEANVAERRWEAEGHDSSSPVEALSFGTPRDWWWRREAPPDIFATTWLGDDDDVFDRHFLTATKDADYMQIRHLSGTSISRALMAGFGLTARRLISEEEKLYLETDRMQGEIDFRYAVAVPSAVALMTAGFGFGTGWVAAPIVLAAVALAAALLYDGWRRERERNDVLIGLLAVNKAKSQIFERLAQRAALITVDVRATVAPAD